MIALLAEMLEGGVIDETGLLKEPFDTGWQKGELRITQQDIRGLQMAKAAVCAGVELLMEAMGTDASRIDKVFLAGGFGYFLDVEKAARIGLFPSAAGGKGDCGGEYLAFWEPAFMAGRNPCGKSGSHVPQGRGAESGGIAGL